jgi:signal transduction histidine kinase
MVQRLHDTAARQEAFIADAAHELRSPIASIRTQIEVALSLPTDAAQWEATGTGVLHDVERVGRLADDLLLLARMDAGAPLQREVVDISRLFELDLEPLWVEAEPRALRRAFDNLVANARRHARQRVEVTARAEAHEIIVDIDDDGVGVPVADRERVFDRWLRLDEARARDQGGSGLGLAIAKSVAAGHGGDVVILDSPLGGARLRLRLPMAPRPSSSAVALTLRSRAEPGDPAAAPQRGDR